MTVLASLSQYSDPAAAPSFEQLHLTQCPHLLSAYCVLAVLPVLVDGTLLILLFILLLCLTVCALFTLFLLLVQVNILVFNVLFSMIWWIVWGQFANWGMKMLKNFVS